VLGSSPLSQSIPITPANYQVINILKSFKTQCKTTITEAVHTCITTRSSTHMHHD